MISQLGAAQAEERIPSLSRDALVAAAKIGQTLLPGERIELGLPVHGRSAHDTVTFDRDFQRTLARYARVDVAVSGQFEGEVESHDETGPTWHACIRTSTRQVVRFEVRPGERELLIEAMRDRPLQRVVIEGSGVEKSSRIDIRDVRRLEVVDHLRAEDIRRQVHARLAELRALPSGWLDGEGAPLDPALAELASAALTRVLCDDARIPLPAVFPLPEGGVQAQWGPLHGWLADVTFEDDGVSGAASHADGQTRFQPILTARDGTGTLGEWLTDVFRSDVSGTTPDV